MASERRPEAASLSLEKAARWRAAPAPSRVALMARLLFATYGWFWAVQLFPAVAADSGTAETREAAMDAFKAQWIARRGWEHPWITRP